VVAPGQMFPQAPQLAESLVTLSSQPVAALPSQSPKPGSQAKEHWPVEQTGEELATARQGWAQAPQFATLSLKDCSQPLAGSASQSPKSGAHAQSQAFALQVAAAPAGATQAFVQLPQKAGSSGKKASQPLDGTPSQSPWSAWQAWTHAPAAHVATVPTRGSQALAQAPQFARSVWRSTQAPLQSVCAQLGPESFELEQPPSEPPLTARRQTRSVVSR